MACKALRKLATPGTVQYLKRRKTAEGALIAGILSKLSFLVGGGYAGHSGFPPYDLSLLIVGFFARVFLLPEHGTPRPANGSTIARVLAQLLQNISTEVGWAWPLMQADSRDRYHRLYRLPVTEDHDLE